MSLALWLGLTAFLAIMVLATWRLGRGFWDFYALLLEERHRQPAERRMARYRQAHCCARPGACTGRRGHS